MCGDCEAQGRTGTGDHGETSGPEHCSCWYEGRAAAEARVGQLEQELSNANLKAATAALQLKDQKAKAYDALERLAQVERERDEAQRNSYEMTREVNVLESALRRFVAGEISSRKLADIFRVSDSVQFSRDLMDAIESDSCARVAALEAEIADGDKEIEHLSGRLKEKRAANLDAAERISKLEGALREIAERHKEWSGRKQACNYCSDGDGGYDDWPCLDYLTASEALGSK